MSGGIRLTALLAFAVVSALVAFSSARDSAFAAPAYTPVAAFCIEQFESPAECDGDPAPGGSPDVRTKFCLGWGGAGTTLCTVRPDFGNYKESNSGGLIGFTPSNFTLVPGAPIGAISGVLESTAVLGLLSASCDKAIDVKFTFMNASIDVNDTIDPKVVGEANVFEDMARDKNGNGIPDGVDKYPTFLRNNFDPDWEKGPDGRPNYAGDSSQDDIPGPTAPVAPISRSAGFTKIYGNWISLQLLLFKPGDLLPFAGDDVQFKDIGFPLITVLGDPTVPPSPLAISDFCAPLRVQTVNFGLARDNPCTGGIDTGSTRGNCPAEFDQAIENLGYPLSPCDPSNTMDEDQDGTVNDGCPQVNAVAETSCNDTASEDGEDSTINDGCPQVGEKSEGGYIGGACSGCDEGGCQRYKLPAEAGTASIFIVTASQRDADGDGVENSLDVCSLKANPEWVPRKVDLANDSEPPIGDGLPSVCDPDPAKASPGSPLTPANPNRSCFDTGLVGPDEDQDCYSNRQDNCPLHDQQDLGASAGDSLDNRPVQTDEDEDGIGDACDVTDCNAAPPGAYKGDPAQYKTFCTLFGTGAGPTTRDGDRTTMCLTASLAIGSPPSLSVAQENRDPNCYLAALVNPGAPEAAGAGGGAGAGTAGGRAGAGGGAAGGGVGGPVTGVGSLSPVAGSVPAWAAVIGGLGVAGLIGSIGILGSRAVRRRD